MGAGESFVTYIQGDNGWFLRVDAATGALAQVINVNTDADPPRIGNGGTGKHKDGEKDDCADVFLELHIDGGVDGGMMLKDEVSASYRGDL